MVLIVVMSRQTYSDIDIARNFLMDLWVIGKKAS